MMKFLIPFLLIISSAFSAELTLQQKLSLKIPSFKLDKATLREAISEVRKQAKAVDPDKKGINIIVQYSNSKDTTEITLNLTDVPIQDAIGYICQSAGLNMNPSGKVVLISKDLKKSLTTKFYRVGNSFKSFVNNKKPNNLSKNDLIKFFKTMGVSFPQGSTIAYISSKNMVSLTNTTDNQKKAKEGLAAFNILR
ncbi:MAG: hypothetical protein NE334_02890 [Lentisphaeraceae bacterium]|nr:hypothetical protein [Lentisphaeraceae bacterium]